MENLIVITKDLKISEYGRIKCSKVIYCTCKYFQILVLTKQIFVSALRYQQDLYYNTFNSSIKAKLCSPNKIILLLYTFKRRQPSID